MRDCTTLYYVVQCWKWSNMLFYVSSKLFNLVQARKNIIFEIVQRCAMLYNAGNGQICYFLSPKFFFSIWYKLVQRCTTLYNYSALPEMLILPKTLFLRLYNAVLRCTILEKVKYVILFLLNTFQFVQVCTTLYYLVQVLITSRKFWT